MKQAIQYMKPRVVKITCTDTGSKGTGFIISPHGHIATNFHVIGGLQQIEDGQTQSVYSQQITVSGEGFENLSAAMLQDRTREEHVQHDYAILKIDRETPNFFELGSGEDVEEGDEVFFSGFPLTQNTLTSHKGYVSSLREARRFVSGSQRVIDIDGTVVGGNSGGPLIIKTEDSDYKVVGIISQQVVHLSQTFAQLQAALQRQSQSGGGVIIGGINPNGAALEIIKVLRANLSTGIGTAIYINYLKEEYERIINS